MNDIENASTKDSILTFLLPKGSTVFTIAQELDIDTSDSWILANELKREGLVELLPDLSKHEHDMFISLTDKGRIFIANSSYWESTEPILKPSMKERITNRISSASFWMLILAIITIIVMIYLDYN